VQAGQTVRIDVVYYSPTDDDANEPAEAEPVLVMANGAVIWTVQNSGASGATQSFVYTATAPTNLSWSAPGWDGDESIGVGATSMTTTPPPQPPPPQLTTQQKQRYQRYSVLATQFAIVFSGAGTFGAAPPQIRFGLWATGVLSGYTAYYLNQLARDPIDPDYTDIVMPAAYPIPPGGTCLTKVTTALGNLAELADAASMSYNREQGAIQPGDPNWTGQQAQAMLSYAGQVDALLQNFRATTRCLPVRLSPTTGGAVTASDIAAFLTEIATNGLPPEAMAALTAEGVTDPNDVANFIAAITTADPVLVATAFNALMGPRPRAHYWQALLQAMPLQ